MSVAATLPRGIAAGMPLRLVRADSTVALWRRFVDAFLGDVGDCRGPSGYAAFAWLTHRLHRDRLWREAARRGLPGWLNPPHAFFSELPRRFGLEPRMVGLLERQVLLDEAAQAAAAETWFRGTAGPGTGRGLGRAADQVLGELLPEGVTAADLAEALSRHAAGDEFARRRNAWLISVVERYVAALSRRRVSDPRAVHAMVADRIAAGALPGALGGAGRLHIYGLATVRTRRRLLGALAAQDAVEAVAYVHRAAAAEWVGLAQAVEDLPGGPGPVAVQPAPDEHRELDFVALQIKRLRRGGGPPLEDMAVVVRTGRQDARLAHEALEQAGVPTTARVRTRLDEVPALRAMLQLFRAAAARWAYRPLRHVLENSCFGLGVDLRAVDHLASERRIVTLEQWTAALAALQGRVEAEPREDRDPARFRGDRLTRTLAAFREFAARAGQLDRPRAARDWIALAREVLDPGWFHLRRRVCAATGDRHDLVRLDQQGIEVAVRLLDQWARAEADATALSGAEWHDRLGRFLAANEITLATPRRTGVQVIEAHEAALVPFAHTFLVHANDGEFPKRPPPGWLLDDDERERLAAAGLPLGTAASARARERALWAAVTSGPDTTITYRTADAAGTPLLPSLLVPEHDPGTEIPRTRYVWPEPYTREQAARRAVQALEQAAAAGRPAVATPCASDVRLAVLRAVAETARHAEPGPWAGLIRDPAVLAVLDRRFGPDRVWSASQLELWARNPFVFLVQRVLHLDEQAEADEDASPLVQGGVAHRLLERFFSAVRTDLPAPFAGLAGRYHAVADAVFADLERDRTWLGLPQLWRIRREALRRMVAEYLTWDLDRLEAWRPRHLEYAFGTGDLPPVTIRGRDRHGAEVALLIRGSVDRVDHDGSVCRVIDYKTGPVPSPRGYRDGAVLQAPLYLAALAAQGLPVASAEYRALRARKAGARVVWGDEACQAALTLALSIPALVRAGRFEPSAAASVGWQGYWPGGLALYRAQAAVEGSRFDD